MNKQTGKKEITFTTQQINLVSLVVLLGSGAIFIPSFIIIHGKVAVKEIKFWLGKNLLAPFTHCKKPVKAKIYKASTLAPGVILGLVPIVIALITGWAALLIFGIIFLFAASGDFLLYIRLKGFSDEMLEDHPDEMGCIVK